MACWCCKNGKKDPADPTAEGVDDPHSDLTMVQTEDEDIKAIIDAHSNFADILCDVLFYGKPGSLVFSPFSIGAVIAMAQLGARGVTAEQIEKTFSFPSDNEQIINGYAKILASYTNGDGKSSPVLVATNTLFFQTGIDLKPEFLDACDRLSCSDAYQVDFKNVPLAVSTINETVEKSTRGKIKNLVDKEMLNSKKIRLLLVNGVYFKGLWQYAFRDDTQESNFYLNRTDTVKVDTMEVVNKFIHGFDDLLDAHVVALPYKASHMSFVIFVPVDKVIGLDRVVDGLKRVTTRAVLRKCTKKLVKLLLPRFKVESSLFLKKPLKKLGVISIFEEGGADLSGLTMKPVNPPLFVEQIVQKAIIRVNEGGTGAGSDPFSIVNYDTSERSPKVTVEVTANRPFLFQIFDHRNAVIIVDGCITNPLESK